MANNAVQYMATFLLYCLQEKVIIGILGTSAKPISYIFIPVQHDWGWWVRRLQGWFGCWLVSGLQGWFGCWDGSGIGLNANVAVGAMLLLAAS